MEDNLLLIQQINLMIQKEGEEQTGFDDVIHAAQQHIDSINTVFTLGVSWLKDETEFSLGIIQGSNCFGFMKRLFFFWQIQDTFHLRRACPIHNHALLTFI